jgi:L-lactate dehydrogenase
MKISIIGTGHVGSTIAYTLMLKGLGTSLVLADRTLAKAQSDAHDLSHAMAFTDHIVPVEAGELERTAQSDIVIVTASVPWKPEYSSRFDLGPGNLALYRELIPRLADLSPSAVLIIITNPLDAMTYFAIEHSQFDWRKVLGVGTLIDSARFRKMLSEKHHIHPDDIRAYVLGEHGQTQFPALSMAYAGGSKISDEASARFLLGQSEAAAHAIVRGKGYTNFAISMAVALIVESIVYDENRTMPICVKIDGYLGVRDVCLSLPVVVGRHGILRTLEPALNENEEKAFLASAEAVKKEISLLSGI